LLAAARGGGREQAEWGLNKELPSRVQEISSNAE
jgi:hypothetical protein